MDIWVLYSTETGGMTAHRSEAAAKAAVTATGEWGAPSNRGVAQFRPHDGRGEPKRYITHSLRCVTLPEGE